MDEEGARGPPDRAGKAGEQSDAGGFGVKAMDEARIDAFILPVASYAPKLNGDRNTTPAGANTGIASALHWPAVAVPMGTSHENLPSGLQIVGRPWSELTLLEIAYAYEQSTRHRRAPPLDGAAAMSDKTNIPEIVAEVTHAFECYNAALGAGDVEALNGFFWNSPNTKVLFLSLGSAGPPKVNPP